VCGVLYTAGAPCCPACRATEHEEEKMPKITAGEGGPSSELDPDEPAQEPEADAPAEPPPASAPKAEHVDHAVEALGVDRDEAESMKKLDLVELNRAADPAPAPAPAKAPRPAPRGASSG
jgi:hypothetical protein